MKNTKIQVLIPTLNNVDDIDVTLESIWNQTISMEDVYVTVMDFGSTDGTYEKLLRHNNFHYGVYRNPVTQNHRLMISYLMKMQKYFDFEVQYPLRTILYPGDILYPDYMEICSDVMIESWGHNPTMLISESDIWGACEKKAQLPLFEKDCIIDGSKNITLFSDRGYRHQIQCLLPMFQSYSNGLKRFYGEMNEQRWWNKLYLRNIGRKSIYLRKPLSCQKPVLYDDESEEILYRWESIITNLRHYAAKNGEIFDTRFEESAKKNLSEYALWRGYLLLQQHNNKCQKEATDCILLSGIIFPKIKENDLYLELSGLAAGEDNVNKGYLDKYFESHGMN